MTDAKRAYASFNIGCDGFVEVFITPGELRAIADRFEKEWETTGLKDPMPKIEIPSGRDFSLHIVYRE